MKKVKIFIKIDKDIVIFKYNYLSWYKIKNGERVMSAEGFSYDDFMNQVLAQYPLNSVQSFVLENISE